MIGYIFVTFVGLIFAGLGYQALVAPRRWMKQYGDGVYSPLRRAYQNAAKKR